MKLSEKVKDYLNWIGIVAAAITGIVTVSNYYFADYKVSALGNVMAYQVAPNDSNAIRIRDTLVALNELAKRIKSQYDIKLKQDTVLSIIRNEPTNLVTSDERRYIQSLFSLEYRVANFDSSNNFPRLKTVWSYEIKNEGSKTLKNVTLKLPLSGYAKLYNNEGKISIIKFEQTISIGEIQPSLGMKLYCWSEEPELNFIKDEQKIVHDDGSEEVIFKEQPMWIFVWNRKYYHLPALVSFYIFVILLYNLCYYVINRWYIKGQNLVWTRVGNLQAEIEKRDKEIENLKKTIADNKGQFDWKKLLSVFKK